MTLVSRCESEKMSKDRKSGDIRLGESLDISEAGPLAAELIKLRGADIRIDASHVRKAGGQCLQVLLSGFITSAQDGTHFEIVDPSSGFTESIESLGLDLSIFSSQEPAI
jgi:chemotaxis protein CheX